MTSIVEYAASSTGTSTPIDVIITSGLAEAEPSPAKDGLTTTDKEAALKARALKRADKREKNHRLAVDLSKAGDTLLELKDYAGACANYLHATKLWPSNDQTYLKLTEAYLKCELYSEATKAATRGLSFNPKSLQQRYLRGVARLEQQLLDAAKADLTTVLTYDPNHVEAKSKRDLILKHFESITNASTNEATPAVITADTTASAPSDAKQDSSTEDQAESTATNTKLPELPEIDFDFPKFDDDKLEIASLSDSSEANHYGNGIPCRFYNHSGCAKGQSCEFSHAPDEKSVRDDLGRNVCIYFLLDSCKFGIPKCVYSHSRQNLPTDGKGWWNDEKQRLKVKSVLEMAETKVKEKKIEIKQELKEKAAAKKLKKKSTHKPQQEATAEDGKKADEQAKGEEGKPEATETGVAEQKKKSSKPKKKTKPEGDKGATTAEGQNIATPSPDTQPAEAGGQSLPEGAQDGEKKAKKRQMRQSYRKRKAVAKKENTTEVAANGMEIDPAPVDATSTVGAKETSTQDTTKPVDMVSAEIE